MVIEQALLQGIIEFRNKNDFHWVENLKLSSNERKSGRNAEKRKTRVKSKNCGESMVYIDSQ